MKYVERCPENAIDRNPLPAYTQAMSLPANDAATGKEPWHEPASRPIDVNRWSDYSELNGCLSQLITEIERAEPRQRARRHQSAKRLRDAVRCIVLDVYVAWLAHPGSVVGVPLGKDRFKHGSRYDALWLTYDSFKAAYDGLVDLGYVEVVKPGFRDERTGKGRVTRVRATERLIDLLAGPAQMTVTRLGRRPWPEAGDPIELRDANKDPLDYVDTNHTVAMRTDLERINTQLARHWIDLHLTDKQMSELNSRMANDLDNDGREAGSVDLSAKYLRRIFNNGDWTQGGRFYGGWWQNVPKEHRSFIRIDDKRTVEVDYSAMHPVMMYAEVGEKLTGDAYDIGLPHVPRETIKVAFNRLVNANGRMAPEPSIADYGLTSKELRERVIKRHQPIARFLGTGQGIRLQNLDADMANKIMLRFVSMGYVCLPVHDSFIVHHALEDELSDVMNEEFKSQYGVGIRTKVKQALSEYEEVPNSLPIDSSIEELLNPSGDYAGYDTRLISWNTTRRHLEGS